MEDEKFCGFTVGFAATTDVDNHGERLTLEALQKMKHTIESDPTRRFMNLNHDRSQRIGEIVDSELVIKDEWAGLKVKTGIYKGREDVLEKIRKGELSGLSIEAIEVKHAGKFSVENAIPAEIKLNAKYSREVAEILDSIDVGYNREIKKSLDVIVAINLIINNIPLLISTIKLLYDWWQRKSEEEKRQANVTITVNNTIYNFYNDTPEDIAKKFQK